MNLYDLGQEIKSLRENKNWTQDDLEIYSGISKKTILRVENGFIDEVGIKNVESILDLFGVEFTLRRKNIVKTFGELKEDLKRLGL